MRECCEQAVARAKAAFWAEHRCGGRPPSDGRLARAAANIRAWLALRALGRCRVLRIRTGDVLVLEHPKAIGRSGLEHVAAQVHILGLRALVLDEGLTLRGAISQASAERMALPVAVPSDADIAAAVERQIRTRGVTGRRSPGW